LLIATGVSVDLLHQPVFDIAITLLWIVGITNAMNLLDNMDGLSGGIAAIAAGFFLLLSATNGQYLVGSLSAALLGASIGFLVYNFNPASIFMGDAGSLFIGFMLAAVGLKLRFPTHPLVITWFLPILVLGVPIFDTTLVCISRLRRGLNPLTTPGKDHLSHRLVERGLTRREAVLTLYLAATALGVIAMFCVQASIVEAYIAFAGVLLAGILALYEFEFRKSSLRK
jgi:UDP-GlcNAc:undecaprenyl-phosphate GlcNAc-1-phosphate transferase